MTGYNKCGVTFKYLKKRQRWIRKRDSHMLSEFHRTLKTKKIFREFYKKFAVAGKKLDATTTPGGNDMLALVRYASTLVSNHDVHTFLYDNGQIRIRTCFTESDMHKTTSVNIEMHPNSVVDVAISQYIDNCIAPFRTKTCDEYIYKHCGKRFSAEQISQDIIQNRLSSATNIDDMSELMHGVEEIIKWYGSVVGAHTFKLVSCYVVSYRMSDDDNEIGGDSHETKEL